MRSGGRQQERKTGRFARYVVLGAVIVATISGSMVAADADPTTAHQWAVTRSADGRLHVVRGVEVAIAQMNRRLGRTTTDVLTTEAVEPVHSLGDPDRPEQWALNAVPYEATWSATRGAGVTVAVVDTGVLGSHEDLWGSVIPGEDLADDAARVDPWGIGMVDPGGHGTHVAGIIAAHVNNGLGIAGAAPDVKILPMRVLNASGSGTSDKVAQAIIDAADRGARVINLSLGGGPSPGEEAAIQYANSKNAVVLAAGGNDFQNGNAPTYPAAYPEAIAVAATNGLGGHAYFSNVGSYIDVAAPGDSILSTYGAATNDYEWMSGTSMATPYASAAAALIVSENRSLTAAQITTILEGTATDLGAPGRDDTFGYGQVNPRAAVAAAIPNLDKGTKGNGYWIVSVDGRVRTYGHAGFYGDLSNKWHTSMIVASARTPDGRGYWLVGADGAVYTFGDAHFYGSMFGRHLNSPIVGMAATPSGHGYVLLGQDGGIFTFGDMHFYGSTGNRRLNAPVLDMAITSDGKGYWFVAADGGVFTFGDAHFYGSTGNIRLNAPMRSMTVSSNGNGYWMVADDGGIFSYRVPFNGSLPGVRGALGMPYVSSIRMRAVPTNDGYYILGLDGTVYAFGAAKFWGSASGTWAVDLMQAP